MLLKGTFFKIVSASPRAASRDKHASMGSGWARLSKLCLLRSEIRNNYYVYIFTNIASSDQNRQITSVEIFVWYFIWLGNSYYIPSQKRYFGGQYLPKEYVPSPILAPLSIERNFSVEIFRVYGPEILFGEVVCFGIVSSWSVKPEACS